MCPFRRLFFFVVVVFKVRFLGVFVCFLMFREGYHGAVLKCTPIPNCPGLSLPRAVFSTRVDVSGAYIVWTAEK